MYLIISSLKIHDSKLDEDDIRSAVANYGYNILTLRQVLIMKDVEFIQSKILEKITLTKSEKLNTLLAANADTADSLHLVIMTWCPSQPGPTDSHYQKSDVPKNSVSGSFASQNLVRSHGFRYLQSVRDLGCLFSSCPSTSTTGGWPWERQCHLSFIKLGHMELVKTIVKDGNLIRDEGTDRERIAFESLTLKMYSPKKDKVETTSGSGVYYVPDIPNNPTFDAFLRVGEKAIALQFTIAIDHSLESAGLQEFCDRTPGTEPQDRYFVFVFPKGETFKCKEPPAKWGKEINFFILAMDRGKCCQFSLKM